MKHRIEHRKPWFRSGQNVFVHLDFTEEEQKLIRSNNMEAVTLVEIEPSTKLIEHANGKKEKVQVDNNIYFKDVYGRLAGFHCESVMEANWLHKHLFEGLKRFQTYLEANMSPAEDTSGDLVEKPQEFTLDLIPNYLWPQHLYVLAESGGGKTQLLQTIFAQYMQHEKPPGFVIIDSQNKMLNIIKARFPDALMIDPVTAPLSLDLFNPGNADPVTLVDHFKYLFESGQQPLTGRQQTAFMYAIILLVYGYPKAFGTSATIEDFEEYLIGRKKGKELPERAHRAVNFLEGDESLKNWYLHQYAGFDATHSEILQRLNNICGPHHPLRALFKKQHDSINLYDAIENGRIILVNTNYEKLGRYGSSFFGRFFLKLLDKNIAHRDAKSRRLILMIDEAQEYFDATIMQYYADQARKRNVSVIWANQRLAQLPTDLRDALLGVGTLIATNVNPSDVREISNRFRVEMDQVQAWLPEYSKDEKRRYADFGYFYRGKHTADTFRLTYGQLEDLPKRKAQEERTAEQPKQERPEEPPIDDNVFDDRYDMEWVTPPQHPRKIREGYVLVVQCPDGSTHNLHIPPATTDGTRFCIKGKSRVRRPDGTMGNFWVQITVPEFETAGGEQQRKKGR